MLEMIWRNYADTSVLRQQIKDSFWDQIILRKNHPQSPHREVSDIWVRYNPIENYHGDMAAFNAEHVSQWYPISHELPEAMRLAQDIAKQFQAQRLGAVLITRIGPNKTCYPHVDGGWHARYYEKFALQIAGNTKQSFHVHDEILRTNNGDLYTFDNSVIHWVMNPTDEERITMIVCIRRH